MANSLYTNPIVIDTAGATSKIDSPMYFKSIRWVGCTTAAHEAVVKDAKQNKEIFYSKLLANTVDSFTPENGISAPEGIYVSTLASGKLYLYS